MTTLGIVDLLDSRVHRAAGSPSSSRQVTPGAAAFADVILDASRVCADDADGASSDTTTDDASADRTSPPSVPAAPVPQAIIPAPGSALTTAAQGAVEPPDDAAAALTPVPVDAATESTGQTDAVEQAAPVAADAAEHVTAPTGPNSSPSNASGAVAATASADASRVLPPLEPAPNRAPATTPAAASGGAAVAPSPASGTSPFTETPRLGTGGTDTEAASATAPRLAVGSAVLSTGAASERAGTRMATDRPGTPDAAATGPDASPDAAAAPLPTVASATPAAFSVPTQNAADGGELAPPPAVGSAPPSTAATPTAAPVAASVARPVLLPQITAPVLSLAQAPDGDHSLTLTVSPENLGPVTVRAHISGGAIHIELHAPNDLGREALRAILVDLRRDLAAAAPHSSLMLSTSDDGPGSSNPQNSPNSSGSQNGGSTTGTATGTAGGQPHGGAGAGRGADGPRPEPEPDLSVLDPTAPTPLVSPHGGIEVFA